MKMANNIHELATEALNSGNYQLALELFERILQFSSKMNNGNSKNSNTLATETLIPIDTYIGYGDSLARCGRLRESFNVFAFISNQLGYAVPLDKLKHLTIGLLESVTSSTLSKMRQRQSLSGTQSPSIESSECARNNHLNIGTNCDESSADTCLTRHKSDRSRRSSNDSASSESSSSSCCSNECTVLLDNKYNSKNSVDIVEVDPLSCPICERVLLWPVTMACGHTFCRNCVYNQSQCQVCDKRFLVYGDSLKQDVLISRLVEKWWTPLQQAQLINDKTQTLLRQNALDEALKTCNESLEKCPTNYMGLLLRSEVLYRLNHFQSSLADAEIAIKCRPTSTKAHLSRALALTALGLIDDAIVSHCLSIYFNRTLSSFSANNRLEVAKLIQRLLAPSKQTKSSSMLSDESYFVKEYINRCHLRALRHWSQLQNEKCLQPSSFDCDADYYTDFNGLAARKDGLIKSSRLSHKCRNLERENHYLPYRKSSKFRKNSKKCRQKYCDIRGQNEKLHEIVDLDRLASAMIIDSAVDVVSVPDMDKRITDLFDQILIEISKAKKTQTPPLLDVSPSLIDLSDFDCVLCYRTLWKPVVTPCGHTYCMVCLDRCLDYSTCCPLCKTSLVDDFSNSYSINSTRNSSSSSGTNCNLVSFSSSKRAATRFIEIAMQRLIPLAYRKRQLLEIEKEPSVPVFICTTAYPNVPCPLYVYEPRHRLMIRRAIESGQRQFGIVQPHANGGYSDFGTILDIQDCVQLANGCSILSTIGCKRFKVIERNEKDGYDTARVEYIYDEAISQERLSVVKTINETIYRKALEWYNSLPPHIHNEIHKSFGSMPMLQKNLESITDGPSWAWYIIALLPLNQNLKVEILATTDLEKRLRAIDKTLEYVAAQQRRSVCVVSCEGMQTCQAIDCCMRATSSNQLDDGSQSHTTQNQVTDYLL